jgi:hypothetical protein
VDVSFGNGAEAAWLGILQRLDLVRMMEEPARYYVGAVRPPPGITFVSFGGYAYIPFNPTLAGPSSRTTALVGVGWFNRARQTTELVAHELAHTMGRRHAPCGNPAGPDPLYPYTGGLTGLYGHDLYTQSVLGFGLPTTYGPGLGDIMSYCTPPWISDYTYLGLLQARGGAVGSPGLRAAAADCECLVIWGSVVNGRIRLEPAFVIRTRPALPERSGRYDLRLLGEDGSVLREQRFEPVEVDHAPGTAHFLMALPLGSVAAAARVRVTGPGGSAERNLGGGPADGGPLALRAERAIRMTRSAPDELELGWDPAVLPLLIVREAPGGPIIALGTSGRLRIPTYASELTALASDGIRSAEIRLRRR